MVLNNNTIFTFEDMFQHGLIHDQLYDNCYIISHETRKDLVCELTMTIGEHIWDFGLSMIIKL